jgi:hypothetical protein
MPNRPTYSTGGVLQSNSWADRRIEDIKRKYETPANKKSMGQHHNICKVGHQGIMGSVGGMGRGKRHMVDTGAREYVRSSNNTADSWR